MLSRYARITAAVLSGVTASLLVTAATAQAAAQEKPVVVYAEPQPIMTERVSYQDLNLTLASDQRALDYRVGKAVKRVCLFEDGNNRVLDPGYRRCASNSWAHAQPQIDRAIANAAQLAQNGQSPIAAGAITITVLAR